VNVEASSFARLERGEAMMSSTRGDHRNIGATGQAEGELKIVDIGAIGQAEGELKIVDLSAMEFRVLDLTRQRKTTKEIAVTLRIPERTVKLHVRHGLSRLRARSAKELLSLFRGYH
jgi:DNA-binding CsgD family transcriptional regulator